MLPVIRDTQPLVRRRPVAFCRDSIKDPVACSVFRDRIAQLPVVPWTTDPHTHAELISRAVVACAKKAFPLNTKPRKDSVSAESWNIITNRRQAQTIVLGALHQLRCATLGITFAAWAQRPCVVNALELEVRDIHMRRALALMILSKTASCHRVSLRNDRKQLRRQVQHQIQIHAAAGFSKGVFRGIARLVKKPTAPTPKLELEDGSRVIDERQAAERWMRFASERHDGQPTCALMARSCCMTFFHTRQRVHEHLVDGKRRCLQTLAASVEPASDDLVQQLIDQEKRIRRESKKRSLEWQPKHLLAIRMNGPLLPWAHRLGRWSSA